MTLRPQPGPAGGWSIEIGKGPAAFRRDGFATAAEADSWALLAQGAIKPSTIRIGPKRILGTGAEALRRWTIDQGTLPEAEGGTHLAPSVRLRALMADPACALPLAILSPEDLSRLRARRQGALGSAAAMLVEQAALAAAIEALCALHLPELPQPFQQPASDGLSVLDDSACARILAAGLLQDADLGRAVSLILTTGVAPSLLLSARSSQVGQEAGCLRWAGFHSSWPTGLTFPAPHQNAALLGVLDEENLAATVSRIGLVGTTLPALWLTGMCVALRDGRHLDEVLTLAGLHHPQAA